MARSSQKQQGRRRYAAKLLFAYRVEGYDSRKHRTCQEQIVLISASSARLALEKARRRGKRSQLEYDNSDGKQVTFEFLGVRDLLRLDDVCKRGEVWYDVYERSITSRTLAELFPNEETFEAIRNEGSDPPPSRKGTAK